METKTCKVCGRDLPLRQFKTMRGGVKAGTCNDCVTAKRKITLAEKRSNLGGDKDYSDPDFDGKDPREVIDMMSRAKRWLGARGFDIVLYGEYNIRKQIKF